MLCATFDLEEIAGFDLCLVFGSGDDELSRMDSDSTADSTEFEVHSLVLLVLGLPLWSSDVSP